MAHLPSDFADPHSVICLPSFRWRFKLRSHCVLCSVWWSLPCVRLCCVVLPGPKSGAHPLNSTPTFLRRSRAIHKHLRTLCTPFARCAHPLLFFWGGLCDPAFQPYAVTPPSPTRLLGCIHLLCSLLAKGCRPFSPPCVLDHVSVCALLFQKRSALHTPFPKVSVSFARRSHRC